MARVESTYHPVCCGRPMQYDRTGHMAHANDYTRQSYLCPECRRKLVQVSSDRGLHWSDEAAVSPPLPARP